MKHLFNKFISRMLFRTSLMFAALIFLCAGSPASKLDADTFPSLEEAIKIAMARPTISKDSKSIANTPADLVYQVQDFYYQLQSKNEQLSIAKEVQEHFEKAVSKAEEKFDEGEVDISQSEITKLKLGLSGTRNDVITLDSEIRQASLSLNDLLGLKLNATRPLPEPNSIKPVPFSYSTLAQFLASVNSSLDSNCPKKSNCSTSISKADFLGLEKSFIRVGEAKERLKLAKNSRKISRALLVTEASNYDFGIGDTADLFEALIIYTRVLSGYYESIYQFNIAVADLNRLAAKTIQY